MSVFPKNPIVIIPARLNSRRLPGKPLLDIHGQAMIVRVWRSARSADIGPVVVACAEETIAEVVRAVGGRAVVVPKEVCSGSDRVAAAAEQLDPHERHDAVINVQGDMPYIESHAVRSSLDSLHDPEISIGSLAAPIPSPEDAVCTSVVKVAATSPRCNATVGKSVLARALYFSRSCIPWSDNPKDTYYQHIGVYAYRRAALSRFQHLEPTSLEQRERLEQLRALEDGMRIGLCLMDDAPMSVDTSADLNRIRRARPSSCKTPASA